MIFVDKDGNTKVYILAHSCKINDRNDKAECFKHAWGRNWLKQINIELPIAKQVRIFGFNQKQF